MNTFDKNSILKLVEYVFDLIKANQLECAYEIIKKEQNELRFTEYHSRFKQISEINNQILRLKLEWMKFKDEIEKMKENQFKNSYIFNELLVPELESLFNSEIERLRKLKEKKSLKKE